LILVGAQSEFMQNVLTDKSIWYSVIEEFTSTDLYFGEVNYDFFWDTYVDYAKYNLIICNLPWNKK
jgi:hypothetical protein